MNFATVLTLVDAGIELIGKISAWVRALRQSAELTPEQERLLDERIARLRDQEHWKL